MMEFSSEKMHTNTHTHQNGLEKRGLSMCQKRGATTNGGEMTQ